MLGLGIDNLAALAAVSGAGPASLTAAVDDVDAVTDADCLVLVAAGAELVTTALAIDVVEAAGGGSGLRGGSGSSEGSVVVLRAPGYPRHGPVCARLERSGARFTTAVDLWMGTYGSDREVVGITGTKGKSTVTSLLDQLLDLLGIEHLMGGNIGLAIWEQAPLPPSGVPAVIEVSSYMAADAHHPQHRGAHLVGRRSPHLARFGRGLPHRQVAVVHRRRRRDAAHRPRQQCRPGCGGITRDLGCRGAMHRSEALALPPGCGAAGRAWISNAPGFQPGAGGRRSRGTVPRSRAGDRCTRRGVTRAGRPLRGTALSACDHRRTRWGALHRRRWPPIRLRPQRQLVRSATGR